MLTGTPTGKRLLVRRLKLRIDFMKYSANHIRRYSVWSDSFGHYMSYIKTITQCIQYRYFNTPHKIICEYNLNIYFQMAA